MNEKLQEKVDYIMDTFDFERCLKVMKFLEWKYYGVEEMTTFELRQLARRLMTDCIKKGEYLISTGGFEAIYDKEDEEINLSFILESSFI